MRKTKIVRAGMLAAMVGIIVFALGVPAFAADGPTPPKLGDPVGADISPHGGYSASTNYCLQCHEVHNATGDYALLAFASVTATCNTCHGMPGLPITPAARRLPLEPANPGVPGTASQRAVYKFTGGGEHGPGASSVPGDSGIVLTLSDWSYGWRFSGPATTDATTNANTVTATGGGLYCASCHSPHGNFGQLANAKKVVTSDATGAADTQTVVNWAEDAVIWWKKPASPPGPATTLGPVSGSCAGDANPPAYTDPATGVALGDAGYCIDPGQWGQVYLHNTGTSWQVCLDTADTTCADAQTVDTNRQLVSLYGYKLLSEFPNHTYSTPKSFGVDKYDHDSALWCGACHPSRVATEFGGTMHNHPTGCTACHGNPSGTAAGAGDFPHTSTVADLLIAYPDALCIGCHTGGLP